jgi:hypothetical protein
LGPNIRFVLKMDSDSDVRDVSVPINYEHRDFAELAVLTVFILLVLQVVAEITASFLGSLDYLLYFFSIARHVF